MKQQIVHLGLGNFTRAHQAWYTARANTMTGENWRIIGVSLRRPSIRDALKDQGFAYMLEIEDEAGTDYERIDVIENILVAPEAPDAVVAAIADPATSVVTLTVTEKGYTLNPSDRRLNFTDPGVAADLEGNGPPRTAIGFLASGLEARKTGGNGPLTVLSCDNLPENGHVLRASVLEFARAKNPDMAEWIEKEIAFPCSMVDRIVPATTGDLRDRVRAATSFEDAWPVATERYTEWVIEDSFAGARPGWERAGAAFVDDVAPYEFRKLRMLNGAHSTLAYAGILAGKTYVHEAVTDDRLTTLARAVMDEAASTLPKTVRNTAEDYAATLLRRFANPGLAHRLIQIAMDGSQKLPVRVLPSLRDRLARRLPSPALETSLASWAAFVITTARRGGKFNDPRNDELLAVCGGNPTEAANALVAINDIFGDFVAEFPRCAERITSEAVVLAQ